MGLDRIEEKLATLAEAMEVIREKVKGIEGDVRTLRAYTVMVDAFIDNTDRTFGDITKGHVEDAVFWRKRCEGLEKRIRELEDIVAYRPANGAIRLLKLEEDGERIEARLAGAVSEIEKLKRGSAPRITDADGRFLELPIVPKVRG